MTAPLFPRLLADLRRASLPTPLGERAGRTPARTLLAEPPHIKLRVSAELGDVSTYVLPTGSQCLAIDANTSTTRMLSALQVARRGAAPQARALSTAVVRLCSSRENAAQVRPWSGSHLAMPLTIALHPRLHCHAMSLLQPRVKNFINGKFVDSKTDRWIPVHDPATNEVVALTPESTRAEVRDAMRAAWLQCEWILAAPRSRCHSVPDRSAGMAWLC
jgi:hypothetical protein